MRAAFFEAANTITVREAPDPEPTPGNVRLKVAYCGICGSDLTVFKTGALAGPDVVLGHELSATVDLDPGGGWEPGTRVTVFPARGCGDCKWCRAGYPRYCLTPPYGEWGGYAEYTVFPANNLIRLPDALDDRVAALAEPLGVGLRAVALADPHEGDLAYVSGLGPIGLFTVAGLISAGCRVVGADPREDRCEIAMKLGVWEAFDPTARDPHTTLFAMDPRGPRVAFEASGAPDSLQKVVDSCGPGGVVGVLGVPMAPVFLLRMFVMELRAFSLAGPSRESMGRALQLLQERAEIAEVITGTVPLSGTEEAFRRLVAGDGGVKVLVQPGL